MQKFKVAGIGEVLWDLLPEGARPGGAPANFAFVSTKLGYDGLVVSRVGPDSRGAELTSLLASKGLDTSYIQRDREFQTGVVEVELDDGQPSYKIIDDVAWDRIAMSSELKALASKLDAVCFGSLAQRSAVSRQTIREFVAGVQGLRVFDVNLRAGFYSKNLLGESFELANVAKINDAELETVAAMFGFAGDAARRLRDRFSLKLLAVTRGGSGSRLISCDEEHDHPGIPTDVVDTIGAGDAFTATMIHALLRGRNLAETNELANRVGSFVASRNGAMPEDFGIGISDFGFV